MVRVDQIKLKGTKIGISIKFIVVFFIFTSYRTIIGARLT